MLTEKREYLRPVFYRHLAVKLNSPSLHNSHNQQDRKKCRQKKSHLSATAIPQLAERWPFLKTTNKRYIRCSSNVLLKHKAPVAIIRRLIALGSILHLATGIEHKRTLFTGVIDIDTHEPGISSWE